MGIKDMIAKYQAKKAKYNEAKENQDIAEKLERSKKSADELFLEKHFEHMRQEKIRIMANKIQKKQGMSMIDTKMPKSRNVLKSNMKLCSIDGGIKI
jgi:ribosomal protein L18E